MSNMAKINILLDVFINFYPVGCLLFTLLIDPGMI